VIACINVFRLCATLKCSDTCLIYYKLSMVIDHINYVINHNILTRSLPETIFVHNKIEYMYIYSLCTCVIIIFAYLKCFRFRSSSHGRLPRPGLIKCSLNYNVHVTTLTRKNFTRARRSLLTGTVHICELLQRTTSLRQFDYHDHTGISPIDQFCDNNAPQYFRYSDDGEQKLKMSLCFIISTLILT